MATKSTIGQLLGIDGNVDNWNFKENFVQSDENQGTSGQFIAAESTLICAGPAVISDQLSVIKIGLSPRILMLLFPAHLRQLMIGTQWKAWK